MTWQNFSTDETACFRALLPPWGTKRESQTCPHCSASTFRWYSYASTTRVGGFVWYVWCSECRRYSGQTSYFPEWDLTDPLLELEQSERAKLEKGLDKFFSELDRLWGKGLLPQTTKQG